jgi:hypothetical protein
MRKMSRRVSGDEAIRWVVFVYEGEGRTANVARDLRSPRPRLVTGGDPMILPTRLARSPLRPIPRRLLCRDSRQRVR